MSGLLDRWQRWREQRVLASRPIPDDLWQANRVLYPFLAALTTEDDARLRELSTLFLDRKEFFGAAGLEVTDAMAVAVAAQACLPVLHLGLQRYDSFVGIVMHANEVVAPREVMDDDGVVHEYDEPLAGEAMERGPVTLSWHDVAQAGTTTHAAYNVVIHEFAHVLDLENGSFDGMPLLADRTSRPHWAHVMRASYDRFCRRVDADLPTIVDPYGAESIGEYFATACEAFFVAGPALRDEDPYLYDLLGAHFRQDPAARG